ncbi:MAG: PH domain-containing protein [Candidatus Polarisedimenticolia bacterium]
MPSEKRLHPLSPLFMIASNAKSLILPGLLVLVAARGSNLDLWLMLLIIPYALVAILRYATLRYELGPEDLVIRTGLVFRNVRHIPYGRIHNIGSVRNVLHRMGGVAEVRVETAGGGGKKAEAKLQVLSVAAMEELRRQVFERKALAAGEAPAAEPVETRVDENVLLRMPVRELLLYGVIENRGMVVMAAAWGFFWQIAWQMGWLDGRGMTVRNEDVRQVTSFIGRSGLAVALLWAAGLVLAFLVSLRIFSIGWALVKLYGFTLARRDKDLITSCGLLTHVFTAIPARRIQVLTVREGPMHRLFGRVEVRADIVGGSPEDASAAHERIAPLVRASDCPDLVRRIQPELDVSSVTWVGVHPRAARRIFKRYVIIMAIASLIIALNAGWPALGLLPLSLPLLWLIARGQARRLGYRVDERGIFFRSGWLWRRASGARHDKVQSVGLNESPFDRRHGMATLVVDNAGMSQSSHKLRVPYLDAAIARHLHDEIEARAARSAFRW